MSIAYIVYMVSCVILGLMMPTDWSWKRIISTCLVVGVMAASLCIHVEDATEKKFAEQGMFLKEENK